MGLLKAIILGVVQGLSEFLPISSSGHLVLAEELLNFHEGGLAFEVFVHFGTLVAVFWVFRTDIGKMILNIPAMFKIKSNSLSQESRQYAIMNIQIILASIPAAVIGLLFEDQIEQLFESHVLVLFMLLVTGLMMISSRFVKETRTEIKGSHAFIIGMAQALAIIPGISRSGSTIVSGLWMGLPRQKVARFSFILSTPVILGATLLKLKDLFIAPPPTGELVNLVAATIAAMISGYFAIVWLLVIIRRQRLDLFGYYCLAVSLIGFLLISG